MQLLQLLLQILHHRQGTKSSVSFFYFINYLLTLFHNTALHHRHAKLASTRKQTPYYARLNESMKEKDSNLVAVKKELNLDVVVKKEKGKWHMCVFFLS